MQCPFLLSPTPHFTRWHTHTHTLNQSLPHLHVRIYRGVKVWWDKKCLVPGVDWKEGFCAGLCDSRTYVCILSKEAINHPTVFAQVREKEREKGREIGRGMLGRKESMGGGIEGRGRRRGGGTRKLSYGKNSKWKRQYLDCNWGLIRGERFALLPVHRHLLFHSAIKTHYQYLYRFRRVSVIWVWTVRATMCIWKWDLP